MDSNWAHRKADAFRRGWARVWHKEASLHCVVLGLAVATHETRAGDAWPGPDGLLDTADDDRNWGATTLRGLTAVERAVVAAAGIKPSVSKGHAALATAAQAAITAAKLPFPSVTLLGQTVTRGVIHCDSSPEQGPYFVFFAAFDDDESGAEYFIRLLTLSKYSTHKAAKPVLERDNGTEHELAQAMYSAGYFTGFKKREQLYDIPGRGQVKGSVLNVEAYAGSLRKIAPAVRAALAIPVSDTDRAPPPLPVETPSPSSYPELVQLQRDEAREREERDAQIQGREEREEDTEPNVT